MKMKIPSIGLFSVWTFLLFSALVSCHKSDDPPPPPPPPVAEFELPAEIKAGKEVIFVNKSTNATSFIWKINGTNVDPAKVTAEGNLKITFSMSGTYEIALMAVKNDLNNTKTRSVAVALPSAPVAGFKYERVNTSFILPQYQLTDTSKNATEWSWDFIGNATPTTVQHPLVTFYRINKVVFANQTVKNEAGQNTYSVSFNSGLQPNHIASYTFPSSNIYEDFSKNGKEWSSQVNPVSETGVKGKGTSGKFTSSLGSYAKPPEDLVNTAFDASKQISVSMWVKVNDPAVQAPILGLASPTFADYIPAIYYANNKFYGMWCGTQTSSHIASPNITANLWYHIVLNGDGNNKKHEMFMNGISVGSLSDAVSFDTPSGKMLKAYLGYSKTGGWPIIGASGPDEKYLSGNISAVRFFNRVITQEEVNALYHEFD